MVEAALKSWRQRFKSFHGRHRDNYSILTLFANPSSLEWHLVPENILPRENRFHGGGFISSLAYQGHTLSYVPQARLAEFGLAALPGVCVQFLCPGVRASEDG
jgi:hypothetical protein